jgi:hypothetical protein
VLPTEPGLGDVAFISLVFFANLPFITRRIESMPVAIWIEMVWVTSSW